MEKTNEKVEEPRELTEKEKAALKAAEVEPKEDVAEPPKDAATETESQKIDRELREKNQEIADLKKKQQENLLDAEKVEGIPEHFHCASCQQPFYPKDGDPQIKLCLSCQPMR